MDTQISCGVPPGIHRGPREPGTGDHHRRGGHQTHFKELCDGGQGRLAHPDIIGVDDRHTVVGG